MSDKYELTATTRVAPNGATPSMEGTEMTTETLDRIDEIARWPTRGEDATASAILKHCLTTQFVAKSLLLDRISYTPGDTQALLLSVQTTVSYVNGHGIVMLLRALMDIAPDAAERFAREWWLACEAGDSMYEWEWEWATDLGIDCTELQALAGARVAEINEVRA